MCPGGIGIRMGMSIRPITGMISFMESMMIMSTWMGSEFMELRGSRMGRDDLHFGISMMLLLIMSLVLQCLFKRSSDGRRRR